MWFSNGKHYPPELVAGIGYQPRNRGQGLRGPAGPGTTVDCHLQASCLLEARNTEDSKGRNNLNPKCGFWVPNTFLACKQERLRHQLHQTVVLQQGIPARLGNSIDDRSSSQAMPSCCRAALHAHTLMTMAFKKGSICT